MINHLKCLYFTTILIFEYWLNTFIFIKITDCFCFGFYLFLFWCFTHTGSNTSVNMSGDAPLFIGEAGVLERFQYVSYSALTAYVCSYMYICLLFICVGNLRWFYRNRWLIHWMVKWKTFQIVCISKHVWTCFFTFVWRLRIPRIQVTEISFVLLLFRHNKIKKFTNDLTNLNDDWNREDISSTIKSDSAFFMFLAHCKIIDLKDSKELYAFSRSNFAKFSYQTSK